MQSSSNNQQIPPVNIKGIRLLLFFLLILTLSNLGFYVFAYYRQPSILTLVIIGIITLIAAVSGIGLSLIKRNYVTQTVVALYIVLAISAIVVTILVDGLGFVAGITGSLILISLVVYGLPGRFQLSMVILSIVLGIGMILFDFFGPKGTDIPILVTIVPYLGAGTLFGVMLLVLSQFKNYNLRTKILTLFLIAVLGPTLVISFSAVGFAKTNLQNRAQESILIASNQTASDIDTFIRTTSARVSTSASLPQMSQYLSLAPEERKGSDALRDTQVILGFIAEEQYQRYVSYALLDTNGTAIYDSASNNTSRERANELYFRQVMQTGTAYISPVLFDANNQNPALYFSQPIRSGDGQTIGVLVVRYRADILQSIIKKTTGITGEDSFAILVDENNLRLATGADTDSIYIMLAPLSNEEQTQLIADRRIPNNIGFGEAIDLVQAIEAKQPNTVIKANLTGQHPGDESDGADYYALSTLSDIPWTVLYHQSENSFLGPINRLEQRVVLISLVILALASLAAFIAARLLTNPINKLIEATRRVSEGDLTTAADVTSNDEIGVLAQSFNTMTDQLRGTLTGLERRTRAIETSSEVSRRLSTILDPQQLTVEVVEQLRAAFNYYHAHIYLLNDAKDTLLMAGGTGRAGRTMLANKHQIPIGRGLVGRAASTKEVVLVPDVRQEPRWLPNPLLPETKAEIAVPIMAGSTVLGVLDVQQNSVNGLTQEDAILIQSIADQVAIGLENAHSVQQIKAQQELLLLRERAITASNDGIVIVDPNQFDMPIVFINPAFEKITGYSATEITGKNCRFLQGADTNQPGVIELRQAIRDKRACNVLLRNYRKDGTMFWNELDVSPVFDENNKLINFIGVQQDVTDRVKAELELQDVNQLQSAVLTSASYMIIATDTEGVINVFNPAAEQNLGYAADELIGKETPGIFHDGAEVVQRAEELSQEVGFTILPGFEVFVHKTRDGSVYRREWTYVTKDGRKFPVVLSISSLRDQDGKITGFLGIANDITERKAAEAERERLLAVTQESEQRYRSLAEASQDIITIFDLDGHLEYMNDFIAQRYPVPAEQLYGKHVTQVFGTQQSNFIQSVIQRIADTQAKFTLEYSAENNGQTIWFESQNIPLFDEQGKLDRVMSVGRNITERKAAEVEREKLLAATAAQERTLQTILDNLPMGLFATDQHGVPHTVNKIAQLMLGTDPLPVNVPEFSEVYQIYQPDSDELVPLEELPVSVALRTKETVTTQFDVKVSDTDRLNMLSTAVPMKDRNDNLTGTIVLIQDISQSKQAEAEREKLLATTAAQERTLQAILDNLPVGVFATDPDGTPTLVNQAAQKMLMRESPEGINPETYAETYQLYHPDSEELYAPEELPLSLTLSNGKPTHQQIDIIQPNGNRVSIDAVAVPLMDEHNTMSGALALFQDITERKQAEKEREQLIEQIQERAIALEAVAEVSTAATSILDTEHLLQTVVDLTKQTFRLYHAHLYLYNEPDETLDLHVGAGEIGARMVKEGRRISLLQQQSLVAQAARSLKPVVENDTRSNPAFLSHPLLPETRAEMAVPLIVGHTILGVLDVQSDRTDAFNLEDQQIYLTLGGQIAIALQNARLYDEQAQTVQRLQELDQLKSAFLANMSHELRTPLNSILGFTEVILEGINGPINDLIMNDLTIIHRNGRHLLNLINDILDMAKIESGKLTLFREHVDLYDTIQEVVMSMAPLAMQKQLDLSSQSGVQQGITVYADRFRIRQVLLNIVGNAVKFTERGSITISVESTETTRLIYVRDTGIGIPADNLDSIFVEFQQVDNSTTRKAGGTGLGLPISRHLILMHGGNIWVSSSGIPGEGSVFTIELPIEAEPEHTLTHAIPEPIHTASIE